MKSKKKNIAVRFLMTVTTNILITILDAYIDKSGKPDMIICVNGKQYTSKLSTNYLKNQNIKRIYKKDLCIILPWMV